MKTVKFAKKLLFFLLLSYTGTSLHAGLWNWFTTPNIRVWSKTQPVNSQATKKECNELKTVADHTAQQNSNNKENTTESSNSQQDSNLTTVYRTSPVCIVLLSFLLGQLSHNYVIYLTK